MDHLTPQQRSKNMAAIHAKDTKPGNKNDGKFCVLQDSDNES